MIKKYCPECGAETVIETHQNFRGKDYKERRCTGLVEVEGNPSHPLVACEWWEEYPVKPELPAYCGVGIMTPQIIN